MEQRSQTVALIVVALALVTGCGRGAKTCAVCAREECHGLAFRVTLESGQQVETCCARCGLHYVEAGNRRARSFEATDFATGKWIDAGNAVFVSGSDAHACASMESRRDAEGCCLMKTYDRCLPSLVAFASRDAALTFQKEHGGELIGFADLMSKPMQKTKPTGGTP